MDNSKRLNFTVDKFGSPSPYASEHGQYVRHSDYAKLEAESQALRDELAALRARVAVLPDGWAILPRHVTDDMYNASGMVKDAPFRIWEKMFDAAPRLNGKAVSEELLHRIADTLDDVCHGSALEKELRALLGEGKEVGDAEADTGVER